MLVYTTQVNSTFRARWLASLEVISQVLFTSNSVNNSQLFSHFWLVLAYDLLEDRRTIDVIIKKLIPLCFKLAERFENLDDILRDWAKEKIQKVLLLHWIGTTSRKKKKAVSFLGSDSEKKNTRAVSVGSRVRLNQKQNWCPN